MAKREKQFRLRMTQEEFDDLEKSAKDMELSKSDLIRYALEMIKNKSRKEEK